MSLVIEDDTPGVAGLCARDDVEERRLASTVRSDDAGDSARLDGEADVVDATTPPKRRRDAQYGRPQVVLTGPAPRRLPDAVPEAM